MEEKGRKSYPSDLTDKQWEEIAPLYTGMRNCTWSKRELTNAVLYLVDSGCKWRQLPHDFPPYSTVHSFYRRARISGLWDKILEHLVKKTRTNAGREESPSYAIIDSQSVKTVVVGKALRDQQRSLCEVAGKILAEIENQIRRTTAAIDAHDFFYNKILLKQARLPVHRVYHSGRAARPGRMAPTLSIFVLLQGPLYP